MKTYSLLVALFLSLPTYAQKRVTVDSPDGQTHVQITLSDKIYYDVISHGDTLLRQSHLGMTLRDRSLGVRPNLKNSRTQTVRETITPILPLKSSQVSNHYTLCTMTMTGGYSVQWRVYDDAVAYRFVTQLKGDIEVMSEDATLQLTAPTELILQQPGGFQTSCEEFYSRVNSHEWQEKDKMSELPILIMDKRQKILFSEFDLFDYPGMFLQGNGNNSLSAVHAPCPLQAEDHGDRAQRILQQADYIAKTTGTRTFPWRFLHITQDDRQLASSTLPMRLAPACALQDPTWIQPGQTCWDWLNGIPYGPDVNFRGGINLETYRYFVDFAARNGVRYMLMDEGWALDTRDPFRTNPAVHLPELIQYAAERGVGIIVWLPWLTVEHNMNLFRVFEEWGIKGVKIDFMDRQDQWMVNFYERVAKEAAKHHILVDFHGAYHPSGLEYKYPNVLTFEGVRGMEYNGGCTPDNSAYFPYLRNAVGPMDYTPGPMLCYQPEHHHGNRPICSGVGTKAHHLALFVIFESNLQMLMDNPSRYDQYPDCRDFITSVPVNWDEMHALHASVGEFTVIAKRKGDKWFIGGMTNRQARDIELDLSFLPTGKEFRMTSFQDGTNADVIAMDYLQQQRTVSSSTRIQVRLARNGGFAAVIE